MSAAEEFRAIAIADVDTGDALRAVDMEFVQGILMPSIRDRGLRTPIEVRPVSQGYKLTFGGHRLEACRQLGFQMINAIVRDQDDEEARLTAIDENLIRNPGDALQRAELLAERKALYEARHPQTRNGAQGGRGSNRNETDVMSFSKDAADKAGLSDRQIRRSVEIASKLDRSAREMLRGTKHANNQATLLSLIKHDPKRQRALANRLTRQDRPCASLAVAIAEEDGLAPRAKSWADKAIEAWTRASTRERREILEVISSGQVPPGWNVIWSPPEASDE